MNDFDIDPARLDEEWVKQPKLFYGYAKNLADARYEVDKLKAELDLVMAELDKSIRTDPGMFDIGKVTEGAVEKCILLQPDYQKTLAKLNKAKHEAGVLDAAVNALEHKKRGLEGLVQLHGQQYFSEPTAPKYAKEKMNEVVKKDIRKRGIQQKEGGK